jgi:hypothetical protein
MLISLYATGVADTGVATGVVDTGGQPLAANISANFRKNWKRPFWYTQGLGGNWFMKKTRSKNLVTLSLEGAKKFSAPSKSLDLLPGTFRILGMAPFSDFHGLIFTMSRHIYTTGTLIVNRCRCNKCPFCCNFLGSPDVFLHNSSHACTICS